LLNKPEKNLLSTLSFKKVENCQLRNLYSPGQTTLPKLTLGPREKGEEGITSIIAQLLVGYNDSDIFIQKTYHHEDFFLAVSSGFCLNFAKSAI
jgi:hypothetical protein